MNLRNFFLNGDTNIGMLKKQLISHIGKITNNICLFRNKRETKCGLCEKTTDYAVFRRYKYLFKLPIYKMGYVISKHLLNAKIPPTKKVSC